MTAEKIYADLILSGISLETDGKMLFIDSLIVSQEQLEVIKEYKEEIIELLQRSVIPDYKKPFYAQFSDTQKDIEKLYPLLSDEQEQALKWTDNALAIWQGDEVGKKRIEKALQRLNERWLLWCVKADEQERLYYLASGAPDIPWFDDMLKEQEAKARAAYEAVIPLKRFTINTPKQPAGPKKMNCPHCHQAAIPIKAKSEKFPGWLEYTCSNCDKVSYQRESEV